MSEPTSASADPPQVGLLTQRYAERIAGTLGCWNRVLITGTLTEVCHAGAVEGWLRRDNIRCFDLKVFAEPLCDVVRDHAITTARAANLTIEHLERDLDELARQCVPALLERFCSGYHWSLMPVEYSLDLVWRRVRRQPFGNHHDHSLEAVERAQERRLRTLVSARAQIPSLTSFPWIVTVTLNAK